MNCHISLTWTDFCVWVEYQGQTIYKRILDCKLLINTYYCIGHRFELKCFLFAIFFWNIFSLQIFGGKLIKPSIDLANENRKSCDRSSRPSWSISHSSSTLHQVDRATQQNIFSLAIFSLWHIFCLRLIKKVIDLSEVRSENLKCRTESSRSSRSSYWWLVNNTVADFLQK